MLGNAYTLGKIDVIAVRVKYVIFSLAEEGYERLKRNLPVWPRASSGGSSTHCGLLSFYVHDFPSLIPSYSLFAREY